MAKIFQSKKQRLLGGLGYFLSVLVMEIAAMVIDVLYATPEPWIAGIASIKTIINAGVAFAILACGLYLGSMDNEDLRIIREQLEQTNKITKEIESQTEDEKDLTVVKTKVAEKQAMKKPITPVAPEPLTPEATKPDDQ